MNVIGSCCSRSTKCEYLDGSCLASPRWVSLLVAEIYYPDATFPNPAPGGGAPPANQNRSPVQGVNPPSVSSFLLGFHFKEGIILDMATFLRREWYRMYSVGATTFSSKNNRNYRTHPEMEPTHSKAKR